MNQLETKQAIVSALKDFDNKPLCDAAMALLKVLGYTSERRVSLTPNNADGFLGMFVQDESFNQEQARLDEWHTVDFLFQLTDEEVRASLTNQPALAFDSKGQWDGKIIESYLFIAISLRQPMYTRTELSGITRAVNRLFPMPVMLLFYHGNALSVSIIDRRLHKRDASQNVLEKVTLIKDIACSNPLRAHIDILYDLSLTALHEAYTFHNFVGLHQAWEKRLASYDLNERFYREIANWYFWVLQHPGLVLPRDVKTEEQRSIFIIRLITRLIFCWFLQEKGLIPRDLFRDHVVSQFLKDVTSDSSTYYKAVLQNLFFATLNQEVHKRRFRNYNRSGRRHGHRGVTNLYRYRDALRDPDAFIAMLKEVPFINGGLFDCLDVPESQPDVRLDGFSERKDNQLYVPNELFFGAERKIDLSRFYQDKRKTKEEVRGIVEILHRYKFTVEENTPLEEDIALDPELLGKVFENLLASYNEDTKTTARKATGSFYTPREIVNYMVDETLIAYLTGQMAADGEHPQLEANLRNVFATPAHDFENPLSQDETAGVIAAIDNVKILDPACGSGAFPMGALHRLVDVLSKLDPNNRRWKDQQLERARSDLELAEQMQDEVNRENARRDVEARIDDIERSFDTQFHALDFARKLYLIENCIYGVDIQPIACQIAKLRFFIALIVDQKVDPEASNLGVRPLPNLETKIVAADTLTPIERLQQHQFDLFDEQIRQLREKLEQVRHEYFNARSPERKVKCREQDTNLRKQIAKELQKTGLPAPTASALAAWDPYDQNLAAAFFDPAWMFSIKDGFDIVLGNPPYVRQEQIKELKPHLKEHYNSYSGTADLYVYFYERAIQLLRNGGVFSFISSNKLFRAAYGKRLRGWLTEHTRLRQMIDFGDAPVFVATAYPCIVILTKDGQAEYPPLHTTIDSDIQVLNWQTGSPVEQFVDIFHQQSFPVAQASLRPEGWQLESRAKLALLKHIRTTGVPLGEYIQGRFYRGVLTGLNEAFVIDCTTRDRLIAEHASSAEIIKPFLRGRDVKRWRVEFQDLWLIFTRRGISIKQYPAIYDHLLSFKKRLMPGTSGGRKSGSYEWYEIQDNIAYWKEFECPKILYPDIYEHQSFTWEEQRFFTANTCYLIPTEEKWLTALLNSQTIEWFYSQVSNKVRGGYMRGFSNYMRLIPIPKISSVSQDVIERFVDYLLWLHRPDSTIDTLQIPSYFEQILNGLVYELFFPEELHTQKLYFFRYAEEAGLPVLSDIPEANRLAVLRETFERIYDLNHPIRGCLFSLGSLETVRIIEGEA